MPTASLLLLPLRRLLSLIPSVLGLFPVLLRPPPMAARLSPLALPPFVPRLPTFALRPLAFLPTPSNATRLPAAKRPASCPLALWEGLGACPGRDPGVRIFRSRRHPAAPSHRAVPTAPQTPQKSTPRRLKSFLEKTLTARETPTSAHSSHPITDPPSPPQQPPLPVIPASSAGTQHHGQSQRTHATPTSPASRAHLPLFSHYSLLSPHSFLPAPQPSQSRPKNPPNLATAGREHP